MLTISFYARNLEDAARIIVMLGLVEWVARNDGEPLSEIQRDMLYMEIQDCQHRPEKER